MRTKSISIFWGAILILAGAYFLARNVGYFSNIPDGVWKFIFAGASLLFFTTWLVNGVQNWGWLFPASITAGLSVTILMGEIGNFGSVTGTPILFSIAVPFFVAYLFDRKKNLWALIPAWVMSVISLITLLADRVNGNWIGTLVLYSIGLPFLVVYLMDRRNWWALIPAGVMAVIGTFPLLGTVLNGVYMDIAVMLLFALPFLVVFFWSKNNWWALIPAGVFMSIALLITLLKLKVVAENDQSGIPSAIIMAGIGLTFGILWLMRSIRPTSWAKYPALGLFVAAILAFFTGDRFKLFWPIVLIIVGVFMLSSYFLRKPKKSQDEIQPPAEESKQESVQ
jgi:hypothetical protein